MARYLLFESEDPLESAAVPQHYQLAAGLSAQGNEVTLFLVQNGVLAARRRLQPDALTQLAGQGVEILADDFSLRERGIAPSRLAAGVKAARLDVALDQLALGCKALWL